MKHYLCSVPQKRKRIPYRITLLTDCSPVCLSAYKLNLKKSNKIIFTLYPAQSRVGRGNLVLWHSVPHFSRQILEALHVKCRYSTPRFASTPERRNGNININKYFISSSGDRTHNQLILQSQFVPLRPD